MDCSRPGFSVHHQFLELAQTHIRWVSDAIQPSYPLSSLLLLSLIFPTIRVFSNESVLCIRWPKYWSSASASVLPMNIQDWFSLGWNGLILQSKGLSRVFSNTTIQKHQFLEKEMATHSSVLAWRIPGTGEPWWAAIYGVAQGQTWLKRLSSSSSISPTLLYAYSVRVFLFLIKDGK